MKKQKTIKNKKIFKSKTNNKNSNDNKNLKNKLNVKINKNTILLIFLILMCFVSAVLSSYKLIYDDITSHYVLPFYVNKFFLLIILILISAIQTFKMLLINSSISCLKIKNEIFCVVIIFLLGLSIFLNNPFLISIFSLVLAGNSFCTTIDKIDYSILFFVNLALLGLTSSIAFYFYILALLN